MDLIASLTSIKVKYLHFFTIHGILGDTDLLFLIDTGAVCSVIGVNNLFGKDSTNINKRNFERILHNEIDAQGIIPSSVPLKAANNQNVFTYPCVCNHVLIGNSTKLDFFFDISFDDISIPLLGNSFINDCAYSHAIDGDINITGMKQDAGAKYYEGKNVLDFNKVVEAFAQTTNS